MRFRAWSWLFGLAACAATAQSAPAPEPFVRVKVDPPEVTVGQMITLSIEVLAPNYFTRPPVLPEFQLHNAVTRALRTRNLSEQNGGMSYSGIHFEFAIHPQEPGSYMISGRNVTLTYAADPPATRDVTLALPTVAFEAVIPAAAWGLDPFVAATSLTVRQDVRRSSDQLEIGGALTRTVTLKADGTPAMLLPPAKFTSVAGATIYPAPPELQDKTEQRTDVLTATRIDQATYMFERAGDYTLPALEVEWWNVRDRKVERSRADAISLHVIDNAALRAPASGEGAGTGRTFERLRSWLED